MKILLVNPLWTFKDALPVNLAELAGYLIAKGFPDTEILDLNLELRKGLRFSRAIPESINLILSKRPDAIGMTCNTVHVPFVCELSKALKRKVDLPVILGGIHPTCRPEEMLRFSRADYAVRGEGEETLAELLGAMRDGRSPEGILGLSIRRGSKIDHNPDRPFMPSLESLPFPAFHLLDKYVREMKRASSGGRFSGDITITASRGCPYSCIFCSTKPMWKIQRRKSPRRVKAEMLYFYKKHGIRWIAMGDDCFSVYHKPWFDAFCAEMKNVPVRWSCLTRVDVLSHTHLDQLFAAGCRDIFHGIESGSPRIRALLGKRFHRDSNQAICKWVQKEISMGFQVTCSFLTGVPTETEKEMSETVALALELKKAGAAIQYWIMTPYQNTQAVRDHRRSLVSVDRWKTIRQADIFFGPQFFLFSGYFKKYSTENSDLQIFRLAMSLERFFELYQKGRDAIFGKSIAEMLSEPGTDCLNCRKLFTIDGQGKVRLCHGRVLFDKKYLPSREDILDLLRSFAKMGDRNRLQCPCFPTPHRMFLTDKVKEAETKLFKLMELRQFTRIIREVRKFVPRNALSWKMHYFEGIAHLKCGRYPRALVSLRQAQRLSDGESAIDVVLAECYRRVGSVGKYADALSSAYRKRVTLRPRLSDGR